MEKETVWNYVALSDYSAPSAPLVEAAHKGMKQIWRRLWPWRADPSDSPRQVGQKSSLSFFHELFAAPNWEVAASSMDTLVNTGLVEGQLSQVFVGGPHRCTSDMLRHLAQTKGWSVIESPSPRSILEQRFEVSNLPTDSVVVIPQLAHWFLRHDEGLDVIRRLVEWACASRRPVVLACHSWAWSYLDKAIGLGTALSEPRVLAPFDEAALRKWLHRLAASSGPNRTVFREATSGNVVLELNGSESTPAATVSNGNASSLLKHIAAQSRGLPEIAWRLWQESILSFDEETLSDAALKVVADKQERTIWLPSWGQLNLPQLPGKPGHLPLFLMHILLLHGGLPADVLPQLLPFNGLEIQRALRELHARGVAELEENRWRVTAAGYPAVRRTLNDECYLVDDL